jgi:hypothetical protein
MSEDEALKADVLEEIERDARNRWGRLTDPVGQAAADVESLIAEVRRLWRLHPASTEPMSIEDAMVRMGLG